MFLMQGRAFGVMVALLLAAALALCGDRIGAPASVESAAASAATVAPLPSAAEAGVQPPARAVLAAVSPAR